jgi:hypothetical protein
VQYRKDTFGELIPRIMSTAVRPSSTKSSGCGSIRSWIPSRSKIGSSSSSDRQNCASLALGASGRPFELRVHHLAAEVAVSSMARFQYRTAACRSSSSGPDQR